MYVFQESSSQPISLLVLRYKIKSRINNHRKYNTNNNNGK